MSNIFNITDNLKCRISAFLIHRYIGGYFEEKISAEQLKVQFLKGCAELRDIRLDVEALNELGEKQNWPFEFVTGFIESLDVHVPWRTILKDKATVRIYGLKVTIQPKQRTENATSIVESMWNSMASSIQLAEECTGQEEQTSTNIEGLDMVARTIDSILSRVCVKFLDFTVTIEHVPQNSKTGVGLVMHFDELNYGDESANDPTNEEVTELTNQDKAKSYLVNSYTAKRITIEGVTFSTMEFASDYRTCSPSVMTQSQFDEAGISPPRNEILFGKLCNKQEIRVRLKQTEALHGPKVSIEMNLGPLLLFLSPRQVHVLLELANGISCPDTEDTSNVAPRMRCVQKAMTGSDYQRIEQELQQTMLMNAHSRVTGLQAGQGWSTGPLDDSDTEDNFLPIRNNVGMCDSTFSGHSSSMESSFNSSMASSFTENTHRTRKRLSNIDTDPRTEISHFHIRIASAAAVLLHEEVLIPSSNNNVVVESSVKQLQQMSKDFFDATNDITITAYGPAQFADSEKILDAACKANHLRFLAVPIQIEGDEKTTLSAFSITGTLTVGKLEIQECIYGTQKDPIHVPLLTFRDPSNSNKAYTNVNPDVNLTFKHLDKTTKSGINVKKNGSRTEVVLRLQRCLLELDITIIDRMNALLNAQPICPTDVATPPPTYLDLKTGTQAESKAEVRIESESLCVRLRFPISDYRPLNDLNRLEWWKRNLRSDFLALYLSDALLQTTIISNQEHTDYEVTCNALDVYYHEAEGKPAVHLAKGSGDDIGKIRLNIKVFPVKKYDPEELTKPDEMTTHSMYTYFVNHSKLAPPFSSIKVVHESDTPHSRTQKDDAEELVIPGNKDEIDEFVRVATGCAQILIEIVLPTVSMQIIDKHTYELLYNRINNDLLMWKPSAPKTKPNKQSYETYGTNTAANTTMDGQEVFSMCKSGIQYDSDTESNDSDDQPPSIFYSTYETRTKSMINSMRAPSGGQPSVSGPIRTCTRKQSGLTLSLRIGRGLVFLHTPVRDAATKVIPGQHGEFLLNVTDANIFVVSGYDGDDDLGYVCVQVHDAKLHHCDMISSTSTTPPIKELSTVPGRHLHPTIYKSDPGTVIDKKNNRGGNREMLTVAIKIQASHETHHVKTILVAIGLNKATLNHKMCSEQNSFVSHIIDFFNVQDYPIPGYVSKDVLTEFHLHLWDCAIDYRPLHIPLRAVVTMGNFTMSSHLSAAANTSTLTFIAEECRLFLSDKHPPRDGVPSSVPVDLRRDYVSVIEVGLFDLSLKTTDKKNSVNPHFDLRASNNEVIIRTCVDTAKALTQLIVYYAGNGDLSNTQQQSETSTSAASSHATTSPRHSLENELINLELTPAQHSNNLSQSQQRSVNELIGDALREHEPVKEPNDLPLNSGTKIFFFPDEQQSLEVSGRPLPQVTAELGDVGARLSSNRSSSQPTGGGSDTDDDFCIVSADVGSYGICATPHVESPPEIKWLIQGPVRIIENHFCLPTGKTDLLKPPKHFPVPVERYTLCEMTVTWHMYGGSDFGKTEPAKKKSVNFRDNTREAVHFSAVRNEEVYIRTSNKEKEKKPMSWMQKGGIGRDHDVIIEIFLSKVRFQHEVYPETTKQVSRQVLIISDIEIRDRLESSYINLFLYQHTSQAKPKQAHAHMLVIKAVHERQDQHVNNQECCLKISMLPLRLNIDQDALLFLISFFTELAATEAPKPDVPQSKHSTPTHQPPVMTVADSKNKNVTTEGDDQPADEKLLIAFDENAEFKSAEEYLPISVSHVEDSSPIYFRKVSFSPDVPIQLDYQGKFVDMSKGPLTGILMGLGQLNKSELRLKRIDYRHGLLGVEKLVTHLLQEWLNEIKKNQVPSLLRGVGPMHSVVQLFQGIRDLFWLPIEQYQKDGRIVRGLQRGANSFTTSTAMAALELTSRLIHLIQMTAETAYDMLSPGPSVRRIHKQKGRRKRLQPQDIREGVTNAYRVVKEGIGETADKIVQVASHEHEEKGYSGAVGGLLLQIPPTMIKPIILASEATSNLIDGARSQLEPDARREMNQKWRNNDAL